MKNSILTLLAAAALMACNKKETTAVDNSGDSINTSAAPADSGATLNDSASVSGPVVSENTLSSQDKEFVDAAAKGGMMEVMMGELAAKSAASATVRSLGEMMAKDHGKANDELKKWAASVKYSLPSALNAEQQKMYDDLKVKKGADFDRTYTDMMVTDHKKDIAVFKKESTEGSDASLKGFAGKTLPTLEHHLMESEKAKTAVK